MTSTDKEKTIKKEENTQQTGKKDHVKNDASSGGGRGRKKNEGRQEGKPQRRNKRRDDRGNNARSKPEFDHVVLDISRVARTVAGGRRFSFRVTLAAGDRKGRVGVGTGKAGDTPLAIEKAFRDAKRQMFTVPTTESMSIPFDVEAKYNASRVLMKPSPGKGIIAGSAVRPVIELAGLQDISTKLLSRSKNSLNNARVAIEALKKLSSIYEGKDRKEADKKNAAATKKN